MTWHGRGNISKRGVIRDERGRGRGARATWTGVGFELISRSGTQPSASSQSRVDIQTFLKHLSQLFSRATSFHHRALQSPSIARFVIGWISALPPLDHTAMQASTFLVDEQSLRNSPSRRDGVSFDVETNNRIYACELLTQAGLVLELPTQVVCSSQLLLHRFFCRRSMVEFHVEVRIRARHSFLSIPLCPMGVCA